MHLSLLHKEAKNKKSQNLKIKEEPQFADQTNILQPNENTGISQKSAIELNRSPSDEGKKVQICPFCHKGFSGKIKRHIDSVHEQKKPHKCSICDFTTSRKETLKVHVESIHEGKKLHKCSICDYTSSYKGHLKTHIESVHEGNKPYKCSICFYSSSRKDSLKIHIQSAHKGKKHKCSICNFACLFKIQIKKGLELWH
jgi:KRAB domain-containing zinc finger protein